MAKKKRLTIVKSHYGKGYIIRCSGKGIARAKTKPSAVKKRNEIRKSGRCGKR